MSHRIHRDQLGALPRTKIIQRGTLGVNRSAARVLLLALVLAV